MLGNSLARRANGMSLVYTHSMYMYIEGSPVLYTYHIAAGFFPFNINNINIRMNTRLMLLKIFPLY